MRSLWFYLKDKSTNHFKSFEYNAKTLGYKIASPNTAANGILKMQQLLCH